MLVVCQKDANLHSSVPTSLYYLVTNLYKSVADFTIFRWLVEWALDIYCQWFVVAISL